MMRTKTMWRTLAAFLVVGAGLTGCSCGPEETEGPGGGGEPTLTSVTINPAALVLDIGATQTITAVANYSDASTVDLDPEVHAVTFASDNESVATVDSGGLVTAVAAGSATITATFEEKSGTSLVTVNEGEAALTAINVEPATGTVGIGGTQQFRAVGTYSDGSTRDVTTATWSSSDDTIATVNSSGLATGVAAGDATITATSGALNDTATLTVTPAQVVSIAVEPPNATLVAGGTQDFTASALYDDGNTDDVTATATWSSSDSAVATVVAGTVTAVADGVATITATFSGQSATATVIVSAAHVLQQIQVTPATASIGAGASQQFTAFGIYADGVNGDITTQVAWSSSDTAVATIAASGLASAAGAGTTTVTATLDGVTGNATLTVTAANLVAITISPPNATLYAASGQTQQFAANGVYDDGTNADLTATATWSTDNAAVADVSNAAATKGLATAGTTDGTALITATQDGISATAVVTVLQSQTVTSVAVTLAPASMAAGQSSTATAVATFADGRTSDVTAQATWTSSDTAIATVTGNTVDGVAAGTADITATIPDGAGGNISGFATVTVTAATLTGIDVTPLSATIADGTTQQFTATGRFSDGTSAPATGVTWTSSDTTVATIDPATGLATGQSAGGSTITATSGAISGTATLVVTSATISSITLTPPTLTLQVGRSGQLTATANLSDGTTSDVTGLATWQSSDIVVASVTGGNVTGVAQGTASVTATFGGVVSSPTDVTISGAFLQRVDVTPASPPALPVGSTQAFVATGVYSDSTTAVLTDDVNLTWTTGDVAIATISNAAGTKGVATGVAIGGTTVVATFNDGVNPAVASTPIPLSVTGASLQSIELAPVNPTIAVTFPVTFTATGVYSDGSRRDITGDSTLTWASTDTTKATISNAAGTKGVATTLAAGTTTISATVGAVAGTTTLTITGAVLTTIDVTPVDQRIPVGNTQQYVAVGTFSDSTTMDVTNLATWSAPVLNVGTVSGYDCTVAGAGTRFTISNAAGSQGLATAQVNGCVTVTATRGSVTGTARAAAESTTLQSITIEILLPDGTIAPADMDLPVGYTAQARAWGQYPGLPLVNVTDQATWNTTDPSTLSVTNTAPRGVITGVSAGGPNLARRAQINAIFGGLSSASLNVDVFSCAFSDLFVSPDNPTMSRGESAQFAARAGYPVCTTGAAVVPAAQPATAVVGFWVSDRSTWNSGNPSVATVSGTGRVAVSAAAPVGGTSVITATHNSGGTLFTDTSTVTVSALGCIQSVEISPLNPSIVRNQRLGFKMVATLADGTTQDLSDTGAGAPYDLNFTSSNAIVAVTDANLGTTQAGNTAGTATITANFIGVGAGGTAVCNGVVLPIARTTTATVTSANLTSLTISPAGQTVARGAVATYQALGLYDDAVTRDVTLDAVWDIADPAIAAQGAAPNFDHTFTASTGAGVEGRSTVVTASLGALSASAGLTVSGRTIGSIRVVRDTAFPGFNLVGIMSHDTCHGGVAYPVGVDVPIGVEADYLDNPGTWVAIGNSQVTQWISSDSTKGQFDPAPARAGLLRTIADTAGIPITLSACVGTICSSGGNNLLMGVAADTLSTLKVTDTVGNDREGAPPNDVSMAPNQATTLLARGVFASGKACGMTTVANWNVPSANPAGVVGVSNVDPTKGRVTSSTAAAGGSASVQAQIGAGALDAMPITVTGACIQSFTIQPASPSVADGGSLALSLQQTNGSGQSSAYTGANTVWTIGAGGAGICAQTAGGTGNPTMTVQGVDAGNCPVTAQITTGFCDAGAVTTTNTTVRVDPRILTAITVRCDRVGRAGAVPVALTTAPADTVARNAEVQCYATGTYSDGAGVADALTTDPNTVWTTQTPAVAAVVAGTPGLVHSLAQGATAVTASYTGTLVSGSFTVNVNADNIASVQVEDGVGALLATYPASFRTDLRAYARYGAQDFEYLVTRYASWVSDSPANVFVDNVSAKGQIDTLAATTVAANVTATHEAVAGGATANDAFPVTVNNFVLCAIQVAGPGTEVGRTVQLTATGWYRAPGCAGGAFTGTPQTLTTAVDWTSDGGAIASVNNTAPDKGKVTGEAVGTTNIRATHTATGVNGFLPVTVTQACVTDVSLQANNPLTFPVGAPLTWTATASMSRGSPVNVTADIVWGGTAGIPAAGNQYTIVPPLGATTLTATLNSIGARPTCGTPGFGNPIVKNANLNGQNDTLTRIDVTPVDSNLPIGPTAAVRFTATGTYTALGAFDITRTADWESGNLPIATVANANETNKGIVTGVAQGQAVISADQSLITGSTNVNVVSATLSAVVAQVLTIREAGGGFDGCDALLNRTSTAAASSQYWVDSAGAVATYSRLPLGVSGWARAWGTLSDGVTQIDATSLASWTVAPAGIVDVAPDGRITTLAAGTTTITATAPGLPASNINITVASLTLNSINITPNPAAVPLGDARDLQLLGGYNPGAEQYCVNEEATWSSDDLAIVDVSNTAGTRGRMSSVAQGNTIVRAVLGGVNASATAQVTAPQLRWIEVLPDTTVQVGERAQFVVLAHYSDGGVFDRTSVISAAGACGPGVTCWTIEDVNGAPSALASKVAGVPLQLDAVTAGTAYINVQYIDGGITVTADTAQVAPAPAAAEDRRAVLTMTN